MTQDSGGALEIDALNGTNLLIGLYGGPYDRASWEPEPIQKLLTTAKKPPWEFSSLIYDACFYIIVTALIIGQLMLLTREARKVVKYFIDRFFLSRKLTEFKLEDWNEIHINKYTPFQVDYVKGNTEDYRLHVEDYHELIRLLSFVGEQGGT